MAITPASTLTLDRIPAQWSVVRIMVLFGSIYVVQGMIEPTTGLIAQPVESLLKRWGDTPFEIASFLALVGLPWCLRPVFGLLTDFRPLWGSYRRVYLLVGAGLSTATFLVLGFTHLTRGEQSWMAGWLVLTTVAVAATDVVLDAHMIDVSQPLGVIPRVQSVQYGAAYAGAILASVLGGILSEEHRTGAAFLFCGTLMAGQWWIVFRWVWDTRAAGTAQPSTLRSVRQSFVRTTRSPAFVCVALLLAVYHLNPFTPNLIYLYVTGPLGVDEAAYGNALACSSMGGLLATILYGAVAIRWPLGVRVRFALSAGIISNLPYLLLANEHGLNTISILAGFCYMLGGLAFLDLAARACPADAIGTVYATFMSLCNLFWALASWWGGLLYSAMEGPWGSRLAFHTLLWCGVGVTMACWLILPFVPWEKLAVEWTATKGRL
jgi:hypothetical protein